MSRKPPAASSQTQHTPIRHGLLAAMRLLTEPSPKVSDPLDRFQALLLSAVLLAAIPIAIWAGIIYPGDIGRTPQSVLITWIAVAVVVPMYALSRTRYHQVSAIITLVAASLIIIVAVVMNVKATTILYLACVSLAAVNFLKVRLALVIVVANILAVAFIVPALVPSYESRQFADELNVLVLMTVLAAEMTFLRQNYLRTIKRQSDDLIQQERDRFTFEIEHRWAALVRETMHSVSHDVRTPLTSLKIQLRLLREELSALSANQHDARITKIEDEVRHLENMLENIAELMALDAGVSLAIKPVELGSLIDEALSSLASRYHDKRVRYETAIPSGVQVRADSRLLMRALAAVLDNAFRYARQQGLVRVYCASHQGRIEVTIQDDGPGIAANDLPRLFDPFYKVDKSRSRMGAGLAQAWPLPGKSWISMLGTLPLLAKRTLAQLSGLNSRFTNHRDAPFLIATKKAWRSIRHARYVNYFTNRN